jgi:hypothetical protein
MPLRLATRDFEASWRCDSPALCEQARQCASQQARLAGSTPAQIRERMIRVLAARGALAILRRAGTS